MGACGLYSNDTELVVGLPPAFYNNTGEVSSYCGSYIVVTNPLNNMSITARVADASATNETLSMSVSAWRQVEADQTNMRMSESRDLLVLELNFDRQRELDLCQ